MADNKLVFETEVKGVEQSISSIKDLKNAIKDARNEQIKAGEQFGISSKQYEDAAKKVSALKDKVDDLGDSTKSLQGSGIERASQGFNQLGEGLRNLDFDKVKVGLTAIKSALAATGIMLVVQGFTYLVENFDELSKGSGILAKTLQTVGDILGGIKEALYGVTDAIGATNHQLDLMGDKITENASKFKESLDLQIQGYDRQVAVMKAAGQETIDIEINKQKQIIFTNSILIKQIELYVRKGGELNEEKKKQLNDAINANKDAIAQIEILEIDHTNKLKKENDVRLENNRKHNENLKKLQEDRFNNYIRLQLEELEALKKRLDDEHNALEKQREDELSLDELKRKKKFDKQLQDAELNSLNNKDDLDAKIGFLEAKRQLELQNEELTNEQKAIINKKYADEEDKLRDEEVKKDKDKRKQMFDNAMAYAQQGINASQQLSDIHFAKELEKNKGNAAKELEIKKKQFKVNQAFAISTALISGATGAVNALSAAPFFPMAIIGMAMATLTTVAAVAKIASTKFDGGAASGGGSSAAVSVPIPTAPTINTPQANTNTSTTFDETGKKIGGESNITPTIKVNATVGVNEIADKSNRVNVLETQSKF